MARNQVNGRNAKEEIIFSSCRYGLVTPPLLGGGKMLSMGD